LCSRSESLRTVAKPRGVDRTRPERSYYNETGDGKRQSANGELSKSSTRVENETDTFETLFGEPLIAGESKEAYLQLYAAIEAEVKPKTIFDKMLVKDQADKYWEEQRLKRRSAKLIEANFIEALESLLRTICDPLENESELAHDYFARSAKDKKAIEARLAPYGITLQHVQAKAIELAHPGRLSIDRLVKTRETARRLLRKDLEKRMPVDVDTVPVAPASETQPKVN
jgi:hypothetical protein